MPRRELPVDAGEVRLAATLTLPEGPGPFPAVVALGGAAPDALEDPIAGHLHDLLPEAGVAVVTYDRRAEGAPGGEVAGPFDALVADAHLVIAATRTQGEVDPRRVGLWGFGQGGRLAPMAAAADPTIRFLVLVSPPGVTPGRQLSYATARVLRSRGFDDRTIRTVSALRRRLDDAARAGRWPELRAEVDGVRDAPWFADAALPDPAGSDGWGEIVDLDVSPAIRRLEVPVLITHGEDDRWVPIAESVEVWRRAYRGPRLEVSPIPGTGHAPVHPEDPDALEERGPISADYERALLGFVARVA